MTKVNPSELKKINSLIEDSYKVLLNELSDLDLELVEEGNDDMDHLPKFALFGFDEYYVVKIQDSKAYGDDGQGSKCAVKLKLLEMQDVLGISKYLHDLYK
jgi:hypothetical protein